MPTGAADVAWAARRAVTLALALLGDAIENIVQTINEGRPNGRPSFRGRIPEEQIWEIAAT